MGFNTQQPEGGWLNKSATIWSSHLFQHTAARRRLAALSAISIISSAFQHTAARRRLVTVTDVSVTDLAVSTHSSPKAAGAQLFFVALFVGFQHTAARRRLGNTVADVHTVFAVSTHSSPKAAGISCRFS